jgi:hypothetical protein
MDDAYHTGKLIKISFHAFCWNLKKFVRGDLQIIDTFIQSVLSAKRFMVDHKLSSFILSFPFLYSRENKKRALS